MGCEIHPYVERRVAPSAPWEGIPTEPGTKDRYDGDHYQFWDWGRNYLQFAIMTGTVRNYHDVLCIAPRRGLPNDLSPQLRYECGKDEREIGEHSQSWLTFQEIRDWQHWDEPLPEAAQCKNSLPHEITYRDACVELLTFIERFKQYEQDGGEVRLVFGFDC